MPSPSPYAPRYPAPGQRRWPLWIRALLVIGSFVLLLYVVEAVDTVLGNRLDAQGVRPGDPDGLSGIAFAPLLHGGWTHLAANTVPLLVLGYLVLLSGITRWLVVTSVVWLVGGMGTWLTGQPGTVHIGASTVVFGWMTYLIVRGIFSRSPGQVVVGVLVLIVYGGALWGVLPGQQGVSWQGHLFGAAAGVLAARWLAARDRESHFATEA